MIISDNQRWLSLLTISKDWRWSLLLVVPFNWRQSLLAWIMEFHYSWWPTTIPRVTTKKIYLTTSLISRWRSHNLNGVSPLHAHWTSSSITRSLRYLFFTKIFIMRIKSSFKAPTGVRTKTRIMPSFCSYYPPSMCVKSSIYTPHIIKIGSFQARPSPS